MSMLAIATELSTWEMVVAGAVASAATAAVQAGYRAITRWIDLAFDIARMERGLPPDDGD